MNCGVRSRCGGGGEAVYIRCSVVKCWGGDVVV